MQCTALLTEKSKKQILSSQQREVTMASAQEHDTSLNTGYGQENVTEKFVFPPDIVTAIKSDTLAWKNYQKFSPSYKRIRIAYIDAARKRPEEFEKRLANFIKKTKENKQIGFGGIEKYYLALEDS